MDIKIEKFEYSMANNYSDGATLIVSGVDAEELLSQLNPDDVVKVLDIPTIIAHHDHHELIAAIDDIEKFVDVYGRAAILDHLDVNENKEEL